MRFAYSDLVVVVGGGGAVFWLGPSSSQTPLSAAASRPLPPTTPWLPRQSPTAERKQTARRLPQQMLLAAPFSGIEIWRQSTLLPRKT